jgi:hypothetical protein
MANPQPTKEVSTTETDFQSRGRHLLSSAGTIRRYEEALTHASGERFNLFDVLHVGHYEVRTHSPLVAELLNPKGSHGQGPVLFRHFLTELKISDFDAESARVVSEVSIGDLGRLDIVITDRYKRCIIIENKIYAGLQEKQLTRYHEHNITANLLFLTLEGEDPADWSTNPVYKTDSFLRVFQKASYKSDIVRWLESCRKEVTATPCVREAITQYIHLINRLTQQDTSARMKNELTKAILNDKESFLAYGALRKVEQEVRTTIIKTFERKVTAIASVLGLTLELPLDNMSETYGGFSFSSELLKQHSVAIYFEFGKSGFRNCYFGFCNSKAGIKSPGTSAIQQAFKQEFGNRMKSNETWLALCDWDEHYNWDDETFAAIQFGDFTEELKKVLERLVRVANQVTGAALSTEEFDPRSALFIKQSTSNSRPPSITK